MTGFCAIVIINRFSGDSMRSTTSKKKKKIKDPDIPDKNLPEVLPVVVTANDISLTSEKKTKKEKKETFFKLYNYH